MNAIDRRMDASRFDVREACMSQRTRARRGYSVAMLVCRVKPKSVDQSEDTSVLVRCVALGKSNTGQGRQVV